VDEVQAFIARNKNQLGYIMQEASRQWAAIDPIGALTVGPCVKQVEVYGEYFQLVDENKHLQESINAHICLYQHFEETFGFELSERSHDIIAESIGYTLIHEGVSLKKIVQIAKDFYDQHEWAQDDIPHCFVTGLHNEGLI
jgi:hypothetical protein